MLPAELPIKPFTRPVTGEVALPGSKSITNRALLFAALCDRAGVKLTGALFSEDTHLMAEALTHEAAIEGLAREGIRVSCDTRKAKKPVTA